MKLKSSAVLQQALQLILEGKQQYACAAIQDVETSVRLSSGDNNVSSKAQNMLNKFKPSSVREDMKVYGEWWPKGDSKRVEALEKAIEVSLKNAD